MFARTVSIHLKAHSSAAFAKLIQSETIPMLQKHKGFQGVLTLITPAGAEAQAISLWDVKENADAYAKSGYAQVLTNLDQFVEGTPKVQGYDVTNSTFGGIAATARA